MRKLNGDKILKKINHAIIGRGEIRGVVKVLTSGFLSRPEGGPVVKSFQKKMARMHKQNFGVSSTSGTAALHLAVSALQLKNGDEVIVPALANIADCSVVMQEGAKPVFADIDPKTFCISPKDVERRITKKTKAIIVVHMYGQPADMRSFLRIAREHGVVLIEDCAQAAGATYGGAYVGSFGNLSCFSFYQTKHIICGEGGMVLGGSKKHFELMSSLANNGIKRGNLDNYNYDRIGYNYQLTEVQGALGLAQLKKLEAMNRMRRENVKRFIANFSSTDIIFQKSPPGTTSSYFYLTALLPKTLTRKRDTFLAKARSLGVPIKRLYPLVLPDVELLKKAKVHSDVPVARGVASRLFNLYVNPGLSTEDIDAMSRTLLDVCLQLGVKRK